MSQAKPLAPEPTEIAGRYQIVKKLGAGAFGTVYKAKDKILGRMVAIKTIRLEGLAAAGASLDEMMDRFKREAQVSAQLKHPNIVTIYDIGDADGVSYLAMEFIDGVGLERVIATEQRLPVERAVAIGAQVADGLDFAHRHNVVHRDIKPANIMIETGDRVKVTDFGIAKVTDSGEHLTMTGSLLGTPSYMSPEQARGQAIDGRSDLFAAGCVLYEMLAGQKAFRGDSITGLIFKIITEEPTPVQQLEPSLPDELVRIVNKALTKAPEGRYQSGRELKEDLERLARPGSVPTLRLAETPTAPGGESPLAQTTITPQTVSSPPTAARPAPTHVSARPAAAATTVMPPPAAPSLAPRPAPQRKGGISAGVLVGIAAVLFLMFGVVAVAGWWLFIRKPEGTTTAQGDSNGGGPTGAGTATGASPEPARPTDTASTAPADSAASPSPITTAESGPDTRTADSRTADARTPGAGRPGDLSGPTGDAGRPARGGTDRVPARTAGADTQPQGGSAMPFLDEEPPSDPELGARTAEAYRSQQRGWRPSSDSSFGTNRNLRRRTSSPTDLRVGERPAVATLRHVINAQKAYFTSNSRYGTLQDLRSAGFALDVPFDARAFARRNYRFSLQLDGDGEGFKILAISGSSGLRSFHGTDSGFIVAGAD